MAKSDVEGLDELKRALTQLPDRVAKNTVAAALRAGGAIVRKSAREGLPSNYKSLRKSIKTKVLRQKSRFSRLASISPFGKDGFYAHIVEFGTLGSRIEPLSPKTRRKVNHNPMPTGLKPIPFMRSAMTGKKTEIVNAIAKKLRTKIDIEVAKLAK